MLNARRVQNQLENYLLEHPVTLFGKVIGSMVALRSIHYKRNDFQPDYVDYHHVLTAQTRTDEWQFTMMSDASSVFHQQNRNGEFYNEDNSKWVSSNGRHEHVFKYLGSDINGQFGLLTLEDEVASTYPDTQLSHLNSGTFNLFGASQNATDHFFFDVIPWILWGNTKTDAARWSVDERLFLTFGPSTTFGKFIEWYDDFAPDLALPFQDSIGARVDTPGTLGDDVVHGTADHEHFRGRQGYDVVDYSAASAAVVVSLDRGEGYNGDARGDLFTGIEGLNGSQYGDILIGNRHDNTLYGDLGADILDGMAGDDVLDGGSGANTLYGGRGKDQLLIFNETTVVDGGWGDDTIVSAVDRLNIGGHDRFNSVETFQLTEDPLFALRAHTLVGSDDGEYLVGNQYDNTLTGNGGLDVLLGGAGNDDIEGGDGDDTYVFEKDWGVDVLAEQSGTDTIEFIDHKLSDLRLERVTGVNGTFLNIYEKNGDDAIYVWNQFSSQTDRNFEWLLTTDKTVDLKKGLPLTGTDAQNNFQGTAYNDRIDLAGGRDFVYAGAGEDTIIGGSGNDYLYGGADDDTYVFEAGFGHDRIIEEGAYPHEVDSGGDTIVFNGLSFADVRRDEDRSNTTLVVESTGDTIFIQAQNSNYADDSLLVEWVSFDGGAAVSILTLLEIA